MYIYAINTKSQSKIIMLNQYRCGFVLNCILFTLVIFYSQILIGSTSSARFASATTSKGHNNNHNNKIDEPILACAKPLLSLPVKSLNTTTRSSVSSSSSKRFPIEGVWTLAFHRISAPGNLVEMLIENEDEIEANRIHFSATIRHHISSGNHAIENKNRLPQDEGKEDNDFHEDNPLFDNEFILQATARLETTGIDRVVPVPWFHFADGTQLSILTTDRDAKRYLVAYEFAPLPEPWNSAWSVYVRRNVTLTELEIGNAIRAIRCVERYRPNGPRNLTLFPVSSIPVMTSAIGKNLAKVEQYLSSAMLLNALGKQFRSIR